MKYFIERDGLTYRTRSGKISSINIPAHFLRKSTIDEFVISDIFEEPCRVKDAWRYTLVLSRGTCARRSRFPDRTPKVRRNVFRLILLLESPHRDEFEYDGASGMLRPIGPAQGSTGLDIERNLETFVSQLRLHDGTWDVFIVNPVPYMTSLGRFYETGLLASLRNSIWVALWDTFPIQDDFLQRLQGYSPSFIANCCTGKLNGLVADVLLDQVAYVDGFHPAVNWNKGNFLRR